MPSSEALKATIVKLLEDESYRNTAADCSADMKTLGGASSSGEELIRYLSK